MKLSEKICCCRKKCGYSQEMLAQKLGVSRQAVSKWETGESEPEIGKLKLLAETFGVTADWLLSEEEPAEEAAKAARKTESVPGQNLPGSVGRFLRKHGWISGLILLAYGCLIAVMGFLAHWGVKRMFGGGFVPEEAITHTPVYAMGTAFIIIGTVLAVGGGILAIYLRHRFGSGK